LNVHGVSPIDFWVDLVYYLHHKSHLINTFGDYPAMNINTTGRRTVNIEKAAEILGISRNGAYNAAKDGSLPTIRIGKRLLVPVAALERMLGGVC
jgi:excisionase family DNA binding protein